MLKVTFLGTSGSAPTVERGMPALALQYEGDLFLWDVGEGTQRQMMKFGIGYGSVDAVFISHPHLDHYLGLFGLLETLTLSHTQRRLDVFGFEDFAWIEKRYKFARFNKMKKGLLYETQAYSISAFPVKHSKDSYGLVFQEREKIKFYVNKANEMGLKGRMFTEIQQNGYLKINNKKIKLEEVAWKKPGRRIVYSGDTLPTAEIVSAAKGADLLIHEATFAGDRAKEAKERFHTTMEDAARTAKKARVKTLVLMHFSPRYSDIRELEGKIKKIFPNTIFAYDGLSLTVP